MKKIGSILFVVITLLLPSLAISAVITSDTVWSGEVSVEEDILVPEGITLTILPGTSVRISPSESTKTDPEFMSPQTEITIRGAIMADGKGDSPIIFRISGLATGEKKAAWAGIIVDGGRAHLRHCMIHDAETGVDVFRGSVVVNDSLLAKNRYGLVVQGRDAAVSIEATQVTENDYGVVLLNGATVGGMQNVISGNGKKDNYSSVAQEYALPGREYKAGEKETSRVYRHEALLGLTIWQGRIEVNGILRVPEGSSLIIMPGTLVEFSRADSNHDGIGENGILIQGKIIAKGTKDNPILFRSAEKLRRMGDWDAVNIMNSDKAQNLIEYCQIEDAYRGLHFHFSNVAVSESVLRNNYRGIQFQESVVEISRTYFYRNKSALQARDSEMIISGNVMSHNYSGVNLLRNTLMLSNNTVINNERDGLRVREGIPVVRENLVVGNRYGLMVVDGVYGTIEGNVISHNLEFGIALKGTDNIEVSGNVVQGNGLNGMSIQDSGAIIRGNLISDNGERGIGIVSFQGAITANNILKNGAYNLGIDGQKDVSAPLNWWGEGDVSSTIFDKEKDPSRGAVGYLPVRAEPVIVSWPLKHISSDAVWHGDIEIKRSLSVLPGTNLVISPRTRILFSKDAGIIAKGRILARGEKDARITFTSLNREGAGSWSEILLDHANGSEFLNCTFEHATWALHSHFTALRIEECSFVQNEGGLRFTSGPMEIRKSLFQGNDIGIRAFRGVAQITENVITGNGTGIFVREKGGGLTITRNNLFANREYSIRMGDFNDEDVDARNNWWGEAAPTDSIYDARREPGIGYVLFDPYAQKPFKLEPQAGSHSWSAYAHDGTKTGN